MIIELKSCSSRPSFVYVQLCANGHDTGEDRIVRDIFRVI
jgi:hypothetical protein